MEWMIRKVDMGDLDRCMEIEQSTFPINEAASRETYEYRIRTMGDWFFVGELDGKIVGLLIGRPTILDVFTDDLYEPIEMKKGPFLAMLSLATDKKFQKKGIAGKLMEYALREARSAGFEGATLACKENLLHYYEKFGFQIIGNSDSVHGGVSWVDMRFMFDD